MKMQFKKSAVAVALYTIAKAKIAIDLFNASSNNTPHSSSHSVINVISTNF